MRTNSPVLDQNRGARIGDRRSRRIAYVTPPAWMVTHSAISEQATSSRVTIAAEPGAHLKQSAYPPRAVRHRARSVGSEGLPRAAPRAGVIRELGPTPVLRSLVEIPEGAPPKRRFAGSNRRARRDRRD